MSSSSTGPTPGASLPAMQYDAGLRLLTPVCASREAFLPYQPKIWPFLAHAYHRPIMHAEINSLPAPRPLPSRQLPGGKKHDDSPPIVVQLREFSEANLYAGLNADEVLGVFVPTYRPWAVGTLVPVALDIPGRDDPLVVHSVVRWTRQGNSDTYPGVGLEFLHLDAKAKKRLSRFILTRTPMLFEI
ncbi:MAG TPA: PilZ domain-containing protein [Polyangiaceae bacterium]|nr:PilZ domain-containing protein [Polyangiaceae bacterium]HOR34304.1 PilZ domain-containing protein [Polyangiaceae bacterium]